MEEEIFGAVVVGGGVSGLAAARNLLKGGVKHILVIEARNRVGGRTESTVIGRGHFDLGGQWIGPQQPRILRLLEELGLEKREQFCNGTKVLDIGGQVTTYKSDIPDGAGLLSILELGLAINRIDAIALQVGSVHPENSDKAQYYDGMTCESLKGNLASTSGSHALLDATVRGVFGVDPRDISALHFANYVASNGDLNQLVNIRNGNQQWTVAGGMQQVSERLAEFCENQGGKILYEHAVRVIESHSNDWSSSGGLYSLHVENLKDGSIRKIKTYTVVCAMPPPLANKIRYNPPLPYQRRQLMSRCTMGCIIKVLICYDTPFWREHQYSGEVISDCASGPCFQVFDDTYVENPSDPKSVIQPCLVIFINGEPSRNWVTKSMEERREATLTQLVRWFGPQAQQYSHYVEKSWADEEWSEGCPVGIFPPGVLLTSGKVIREPCGGLFWAGTETARKSQGFVDGALESGYRAASQMLGYLHKIKNQRDHFHGTLNINTIPRHIATGEKTYLITGGDGYLGRALVESLLRSDSTCKVKIFSRSAVTRGGGSSQGAYKSNPRVEYIQGSVLDLVTLVAAACTSDCIFHLAGCVCHSRAEAPKQAIRSATDMENDEYMTKLHVHGTRNAVIAAAQTKLKRIVMASTSGIVGVSQSGHDIPLDTDAVQHSIIRSWPYYASKAKAEKELFQTASESDVTAIAMRPSLMLGPGGPKVPTATSSTLIVSEFIRGRVPVMPLGGLSYVDVRDVADAFVRAMEFGRRDGTYFLGSHNVTFKDFFADLSDITSVRAPWQVTTLVPSLVQDIASNISLAVGVTKSILPLLDPVFIEMSRHYWYNDASAAIEEGIFTPREPKQTLKDTVDYLKS